MTIRSLMYTSIGGVRKEDIPAEYPRVWDMRYEHPEQVSENYYPTWSRTTFMDIRGVERLTLDSIRLRALNEDTRESYVLEHCSILKSNITEHKG